MTPATPAPPTPSYTAAETDLALRRYDTVFRYVASENAIFWSRSQLFLVANAALFGFGTKDLPSSLLLYSWWKIAMSMVGVLAGLCLCLLWHESILAAGTWFEHWHAVLTTLEPPAFHDLNVVRHRPAGVRRFRSISRNAAWLFTAMWGIVLLYLVACIILKMQKLELP